MEPLQHAVDHFLHSSILTETPDGVLKHLADAVALINDFHYNKQIFFNKKTDLFYSIHEKEIREVALEQIDSHDICVGYLTLEELRKCYDKLGLSENGKPNLFYHGQISGVTFIFPFCFFSLRGAGSGNG